MRSTRAEEAPARRTAGRPRLLATLFGRHPIGLLLVAPYAIFVAVFSAYPILFSLWISFHDYFFTAPGVDVERPFVGFANYQAVLSDPAVIRSFGNLAVFLGIFVPLSTTLALLLASALHATSRFKGFFRTSYYLPFITAGVALVAVWQFLFSTDGFADQLLGPLAPDPSWLINSTWAMPMIALFVTWKQLGFFVVLYLAALQSIPKELFEAAHVDGAGTVRTWWTVTVPGVSATTVLVIVLGLVWGANLFTEPFLLTGGGGPNGASTSPVLIMYQRGIQQGNPDFAAALGFILIIGVVVLGLASRRIMGAMR